MLTNIVAHDTDYRNFDFSDLTSTEIAEYEAWAEQANEGTHDPLPEDFLLFREMIEVGEWQESKARFVPLDEHDDPDLLAITGWTPTDGRITDPEAVRAILVDLPNGVRTAINDCDVWKQSASAYNARYTPNENWRVQAGTIQDVLELVTMTFWQWNARQNQAA